MQLVCLTSAINMLAAICVCHLFLVLPRLAQTRANTANFQVYRGPQLEARAEKANRARGLDLKAGHRTPAINCTIRLCHVVRLFLFFVFVIVARVKFRQASYSCDIVKPARWERRGLHYLGARMAVANQRQVLICASQACTLVDVMANLGP